MREFLPQMWPESAQISRGWISWISLNRWMCKTIPQQINSRLDRQRSNPFEQGHRINMAVSHWLPCPEGTPSAGYIYIYIPGWPIRAQPIRAQGGPQGPSPQGPREAHKGPGGARTARPTGPGGPQVPRGGGHKGPRGPQWPRGPTTAQPTKGPGNIILYPTRT